MYARQIPAALFRLFTMHVSEKLNKPITNAQVASCFRQDAAAVN